MKQPRIWAVGLSVVAVFIIFAAIFTAAGLAKASGTSSAKTVIPGCQTVQMNDSTPPFPYWVNYDSSERAHRYGSYRVSGGCGQVFRATLLGIGPDSSLRCANIWLHTQNDDGTWHESTHVGFCTGQSAVRVAGFLTVNQRVYYFCADAQRPLNVDQPCRLTVQF